MVRQPFPIKNKEAELALIASFRAENYSYAKIAEVLGLNQNTVKSLCQRNNIPTPTGIPRKTKAEKAALKVCKNCKKQLDKKKDRSDKEFCSDNCRRNYWKQQKAEQQKAAKAPPFPAPNNPESPPELTGLPGQGELSLEDRR